MWIYWKDQCKYCQNSTNCNQYDNVQELMEKLSQVDKSVKGAYGTLKWTCDYFYFDEKAYMKEHWKESETNDFNS